MRAALKVICPILSCCPTASEADVGVMIVEVEPSHQYSLIFCCCATDGSRGQSDKMASDMEVHMKQRCVIEFLHVEKLHPLNFCLLFVCTHHCLLKVYGDQTVDVRTVKVGLPGQHFLSSDSHYSCETVGYLHWCRFL